MEFDKGCEKLNIILNSFHFNKMSCLQTLHNNIVFYLITKTSDYPYFNDIIKNQFKTSCIWRKTVEKTLEHIASLREKELSKLKFKFYVKSALITVYPIIEGLVESEWNGLFIMIENLLNSGTENQENILRNANIISLHHEIVFWMMTKINDYRYDDAPVKDKFKSYDEWFLYSINALMKIEEILQNKEYDDKDEDEDEDEEYDEDDDEDDDDEYPKLNKHINDSFPLFAASHGDEFYFLLENIIDPYFNIKLPEINKASLIIASIKGEKDTVKMLIDDGFNVNEKYEKYDKKNYDNDGSTALIEACEYGHTDIVNLLLDNGADPDITDKKGQNALYKACRYGNTDIVEILLTKIKTPIDSNILFSSLGYKIGKKYRNMRIENSDVIELLLKAGLDPNVCDNRGETPLIKTSLIGCYNITRLLIEYGADVNLKDRKGETALINAAINRNDDVIKLLVEKGADINVKDNSGKTPIMHAAKYKGTKTIELLKSYGAQDSI